MREMPFEAPWVPGCLLGASWVPSGCPLGANLCLKKLFGCFLVLPQYFKKKKPLPGSLHNAVRIWVKHRFFQKSTFELMTHRKLKPHAS